MTDVAHVDAELLPTQVTYPYIMAKTRLQAKYDDGDETTLVDSNGKRLKRKERYSGAIDCLTQVYRESGPTGWYRVSEPRDPSSTGRVSSCDSSLTKDFFSQPRMNRACKPKSQRPCCHKRSCSVSKTPSKLVRPRSDPFFSLSRGSRFRKSEHRLTVPPFFATDTIASLVALSKTRGSAIGLQQI